MKNTYSVGPAANQISLAVNAGSAASCHTAVIKKDTAGVKTKLKDSSPGSNGSIPNGVIGQAADLNAAELIIQTAADLSALPASAAAAVAADINALKIYLTIDYTLTGGADGPQQFTYDIADCVVSTNGKIAVVTTHVDMIS